MSPCCLWGEHSALLAQPTCLTYCLCLAGIRVSMRGVRIREMFSLVTLSMSPLPCIHHFSLGWERRGGDKVLLQLQDIKSRKQPCFGWHLHICLRGLLDQDLVLRCRGSTKGLSPFGGEDQRFISNATMHLKHCNELLWNASYLLMKVAWLMVLSSGR